MIQHIINMSRHLAKRNLFSSGLKITNTFFRKKNINKYTWSDRGLRSLIDYVIVNDKMSPLVMDTHVYRGCDISSDHYLVICKINILAKWKKFARKKSSEKMSYKVYLLQNEGKKLLYQTRLAGYLSTTETSLDINAEWNNIRSCIHKAATETLGKVKQGRKRGRLPVWNEEIERAIKEKNEAYLQLLQDESDENKDLYRIKQRISKRVTREAHRASWDNFITKLEQDVHGEQRNAYRTMKYLNQDEKDSMNMNTNFISKQAWINHYKPLWTNDEEEPPVIEPGNLHTDLLTREELTSALKATKNRKAVGIDEINSELLKYGGDILEIRLLHLLNMCWQKHEVPKEWRFSVIVSLFKKGDRKLCSNYRGISLLSTSYKTYARIINQRTKAITEALLLEEQSGFRSGRSCIDNAFVLNQIIEKHREFNIETHMAFIDYEKAFDRVLRTKMWEILERRGYPKRIINVIKSLYKETEIVIKLGEDLSEPVQVNSGLRQGCSLSPTLFNIYIDNILREWQIDDNSGFKIGPQYYLGTLLFADDQIIFGKTENELQISVNRLNETSKKYNMRISSSKTKVMAFKGKYPVRCKIVVNDKIIEQVSNFVYLGCDVSYDRPKDLRNKVNRFQAICGTISRTLRRKARKETMLKFYKVLAIPTLVYGSEVWVIGKKEEQSITTAEMRFLRSVKGCTRRDMFSNADIRNELQVTALNEKIASYREEWKSHLRRMPDDRLPKMANYAPTGKRDVGRPRKRWSEVGTGPGPNP